MAAHTQEVVDILEAHDAVGTFFVTGQDAEKAPAALKTLVAAGEQIGNHTWSHPRLLGMSQSAIAGEIERTDAAIRAAGYGGPIYVRPPNGKRLLAAPWYLWRHDRTTVMWSLEPDSIGGVMDDPDALVAYVRDNVRPGDIILMHVMYDEPRRLTRGASAHPRGAGSRRLPVRDREPTPGAARLTQKAGLDRLHKPDGPGSEPLAQPLPEQPGRIRDLLSPRCPAIDGPGG